MNLFFTPRVASYQKPWYQSANIKQERTAKKTGLSMATVLLTYTTLISVISATSATSVKAADQTLISTHTDAPILLDGKAENIWNTSQGITVKLDKQPYDRPRKKSYQF